MKCINCSSKIEEGTKFCPICGKEQPYTVKQMYCPNCGNAIPTNINHCPNCGAPVNASVVNNAIVRNIPEIVAKLRKAIIGEAVMWIIIGSLQLLAGFILLLCIAIGSDLGMSKGSAEVAMLIYFVIGIINLIVGIVDITKANKLKKQFGGIVKDYAFSKAIGMYIWNGIMIAGLLMSLNCVSFTFIACVIAALLIDIIGVRAYVKKNKNGFMDLEAFQSGNYALKM